MSKLEREIQNLVANYITLQITPEVDSATRYEFISLRLVRGPISGTVEVDCYSELDFWAEKVGDLRRYLWP